MWHVGMYSVAEIPVGHAAVTDVVEVYLCPDGRESGILGHFDSLCAFVDGQCM